ncbi:S-adenosylmethionine decarboxylase [Candidatus Saganbacteria bacterium]|nr:S-adenosylmethionine decarboxylase [Candidatus Saganbacteria bacterium]
MSNQTRYGSGSHLLLDLLGCLPEKLTDVSFVDDVLRALPTKLGIARPGSVNVFRYQGQTAQEWGVSGVILAAEAHISIHTFPSTARVFVDIFANHDFDVDIACETLSGLFRATDQEVTILDQGLVTGQPAHQLDTTALNSFEFVGSLNA